MATSSRVHHDILGPLRRATEPLARRWARRRERVSADIRRLVPAAPVGVWNLILIDAEAAPLTVAWQGPSGEAGRGVLADLPSAARHATLRVWTPAVETLLTRVTWPGRSRAKLAQALPFLLEEQLLMEPEHLNFTHQQTPGGIMVAVTARERLDAWRAAFSASGLAASFCPLTLGLPFTEGQWSCCFENGQWAVRTGPYSGFGAMGRPLAPPAPLTQALAEAAASGNGPAALRLCGGNETLRALLEDRLGLPVVTEARPIGAVDGTPLRLGETKGAMTVSGLTAVRSLRPTLWVAALSLAMGLAGMTYQWIRLGSEHARLEQAQARLFTRSFPRVPVLDPAGQMASETRALAARAGGAGGFLGLLGRAAPALKGLGAQGLTGLRYGGGALDVQVEVAQFAALTALKEALAARGLVVDVHHVMSRQKGVRAELSLRRAS
ncbi:MAG: type II secretion system protein GspL [Gammaproteobacteria bacterium]|nr:type II secretion system protein GspL [Gammaproteobacteria bacterium]